MTILGKIVKWNEDRLLIKTPEDVNISNEMSFIVEEVIEVMTTMKSEEARISARAISSAIRNGNTKLFVDFIKSQGLDTAPAVGGDGIAELTDDQIIDGCGDINVFSTGTIRKKGYNPDKVMDEVFEVIDSRVGSIIDGKFVKDKSEEAQNNWYEADFNKCKY